MSEAQETKQNLTFSSQINDLAEALAKARKKFEKVVKDSANPFFKSKYADLSNIIEATVGPLSDNGLTLIQAPGRVLEDRVELTTLLLHSSGQWIRCESEMLVSKKDAQGIGSAITYGRRYAEQSILNVAGEDDDGNAASSKTSQAARETNEEYDQRTADQRPLMPAQVTALNDAMKRTGKPAQMVEDYLKEHYKVNQFEKLLRGDFQAVLKWLNSFVKRAGEENAPQSKTSQETEKEIRDKVSKKMWALAAEKSVPEGDLKQYAYERFKVDTMTALNAGQLREVVDWLNTLA